MCHKKQNIIITYSKTRLVRNARLDDREIERIIEERSKKMLKGDMVLLLIAGFMLMAELIVYASIHFVRVLFPYWISEILSFTLVIIMILIIIATFALIFEHA